MFEKLVSYAAKQLELNTDEITRDSTFDSLGPGKRTGCRAGNGRSEDHNIRRTG